MWKLLLSSWSPAALRAARSACSLASNAAAPKLATARMSTRLAPVPKLAMSSGAYSLTSLLPNWLRMDEVAATTSAPSGSVDVGCMLIRRDAATPSAWRLEHMSGSQAIRALDVPCCALQLAALPRAAAAPDSEPPPEFPPLPPDPVAD